VPLRSLARRFDREARMVNQESGDARSNAVRLLAAVV
jgi:hypothetical protein